MAKLFQSLKEAIRGKLEREPSAPGPSHRETTFVSRSTEKEAEQAPPERVGEIVGHSSSG